MALPNKYGDCSNTNIFSRSTITFIVTFPGKVIIEISFKKHQYFDWFTDVCFLHLIVGTRRTKQSTVHFIRDYMRKRNLILWLVANEVERMETWYNPLNQSELSIPNGETIATWRSQAVSEKQWREFVNLAWDISPALSVFMQWRWVRTSKRT